MKKLVLELFLSIKENPTQLEYYTDGIKFPIDETTATTYYKTHNYAILSSNSWFLDYAIEVFEAELYTVCEWMKDVEIENAKNANIRTIWIFTDSQSGLKRLENTKSFTSSGQKQIHSIS
jgi:hypothetical protein